MTTLDIDPKAVLHIERIEREDDMTTTEMLGKGTRLIERRLVGFSMLVNAPRHLSVQVWINEDAGVLTPLYVLNPDGTLLAKGTFRVEQATLAATDAECDQIWFRSFGPFILYGREYGDPNGLDPSWLKNLPPPVAASVS